MQLILLLSMFAEDTEVSSSSESCHTKLQSGHVSANSSLDAFFKVAPASSPKAEVTSSTEDEVIVIDEESRHSSDKQADCSMSADAVSGDNAEVSSGMVSLVLLILPSLLLLPTILDPLKF